jgi:demethylmenaquinone methyltransferase/2-methoxy-6-polyprenyl-1,4-benzoquinol methylase
MTNTNQSETTAADIQEGKTHFGFSEVDAREKSNKVAEVFHSVASKYDIMNDLMSAGIHRLWKSYAIELAAPRPGQKFLDMAGGTGDLAIKISRLIGSTGEIILSDINDSMLSLGRDRLIDKGCTSNTRFVQADAQHLPFPDNYFDGLTIGFGLRNVTDKLKALRSMLRVLKPGGKLIVLEFSKPTNELLAKAYDTYSFSLLPQLGKWIANDAESYQYLAESIRMHPDQESLKNMMTDAGFDQVDYQNVTGGIVAIHVASKSSVPE